MSHRSDRELVINLDGLRRCVDLREASEYNLGENFVIATPRAVADHEYAVSSLVRAPSGQWYASGMLLVRRPEKVEFTLSERLHATNERYSRLAYSSNHGDRSRFQAIMQIPSIFEITPEQALKISEEARMKPLPLHLVGDVRAEMEEALLRRDLAARSDELPGRVDATATLEQPTVPAPQGLPPAPPGPGTEPRRDQKRAGIGHPKRDQGKMVQCIGVYIGAVDRDITPPSNSEIARLVGCNKGTVTRALKDFEKIRKLYAKGDARHRYKRDA